VFWIDQSNFPGPLLRRRRVLFVLGIQGFILALVGEYLGGSSATSRAGRSTRLTASCSG
jgi:hypothetical protein